jgi:hypothetical protein
VDTAESAVKCCSFSNSKNPNLVFNNCFTWSGLAADTGRENNKLAKKEK